MINILYWLSERDNIILLCTIISAISAIIGVFIFKNNKKDKEKKRIIWKKLLILKNYIIKKYNNFIITRKYSKEWEKVNLFFKNDGLDITLEKYIKLFSEKYTFFQNELDKGEDKLKIRINTRLIIREKDLILHTKNVILMGKSKNRSFEIHPEISIPLSKDLGFGVTIKSVLISIYTLRKKRIESLSEHIEKELKNKFNFNVSIGQLGYDTDEKIIKLTDSDIINYMDILFSKDQIIKYINDIKTIMENLD